MPCYVWQGRGGDNLGYAFALCVASGSTVGWINSPSFPSGNYRLPAVDGQLAPGASGFVITPDNIAQPNNQSAYNAAISGRGLRGNCAGCLVQGDLWDCINGACIKNSQYNTPGIYASLAECQSQCGGSKCNGVCVNNSDWAQIQGLSTELKNKNCN